MLSEKLKAALEPQEEQVRTRVVDSLGRSYGTGRRKNSVARVWIKPGKGQFTINDRSFEDYFPRSLHRSIIIQPLEATKSMGSFDVVCTIKGGGLSGQAGALRHGISRALDRFAPEHHLLLSKLGFLTRDPRVVERKKYGQKKARKRFQFSKR